MKEACEEKMEASVVVPWVGSQRGGISSAGIPQAWARSRASILQAEPSAPLPPPQFMFSRSGMGEQRGQKKGAEKWRVAATGRLGSVMFFTGTYALTIRQPNGTPSRHMQQQAH
ncbi:unnamed protein product [Boreogadus saida]